MHGAAEAARVLQHKLCAASSFFLSCDLFVQTG
jgi:hypothetical protein